jgi:hypothetical protein
MVTILFQTPLPAIFLRLCAGRVADEILKIQ